MRLTLHRLINWEYWPFGIVYFPIFFVWAYYSLRARTVFFFNAANPSIKNGGFMAESKKEIYDLIPKKYFPKTLLCVDGTSVEALLSEVSDAGLTYPMIAKPDIGLRGTAVKKLDNVNDLKDYFAKANFDFLVQEMIPYKNEVGIFYVRFPDEPSGRITGIVSKEFAAVTGDGKSTLRELIKSDPRYEMQMQSLEKDLGPRLFEIPASGERKVIIPYGNHARGAKFLDHSHLISETLSATINSVCKQIDGFYFGRLDIMFDSFEELESGERFQIVELNGSSSEPTHIYDPGHSIFFAWRELARHIKLMYQVSAANHRHGIPYLSWNQGIAEYKAHLQQSQKITSF